MKQTDGQTDAAGCFTFPANAVGNEAYGLWRYDI